MSPTGTVPEGYSVPGSHTYISTHHNILQKTTNISENCSDCSCYETYYTNQMAISKIEL